MHIVKGISELCIMTARCRAYILEMYNEYSLKKIMAY